VTSFLLLGLGLVLGAAAAAWLAARHARRARRRHLDTVRTLMALVDAGDVFTRGLSYRVSRLSLAIGRRLGLDGRALEELEAAALLHDIGRFAIRSDILQKSGALSERERDQMRTHPGVGRDIVTRLGFSAGMADIIHAHHEQPDGKGYPRGLSGEAIPTGARILMAAAALDALTVDRPYRRGMTPAEAMAELRRHAGTQFDTAVVEAIEALHAAGTLYDDFEAEELARLTHRWSPSGVDAELFDRAAGRRG
jgi:putative nucleotidyltransferase with HDIG domain